MTRSIRSTDAGAILRLLGWWVPIAAAGLMVGWQLTTS
jgi:hypothetical protein